MPFHLLIAAGLFAITAALSASDILGISHDPGSVLKRDRTYMGIRLLDSLRLPRTEHNSLPFTGLSGLAWSADEKILYALSDHGRLFHLQPVFKAGRLQGIRILNAYPLRDDQDRPLTAPAADSEGVAIINGHNGSRGDDELIICFERQPRIAHYRPHGVLVKTAALPRRLMAIENYDHPNRALESVAVHPEFGLITAAERPLKQDRQDQMTLYGLAGQRWTLAPADPAYGAITDIATTPDGDLLILERIFSGIFGVVAAVIHRVGLKPSNLSTEKIVRLELNDGHLIDNFEGLTHHRDNRYFMISDDNRHPLQQILLFYFEIIER